MLCISAASPSCGVCPSVCPSRSCILSKLINISFKFFHHLVATPFQFFPTERYGIVPTGSPSPYGGVECRWGRQKSRFSTDIGSITSWEAINNWRSIVQFTAHIATHQWILFITASMEDHAEEKIRERNLILERSRKSEAGVITNRRLRSTYCIKANYRPNPAMPANKRMSEVF